jgi:hypothetical protein
MLNLFQSSLFGAPGATASGASWGSISGTLSSQTDLQNALNAKLNLTGGALTGPVVLPLAANIGIANARAAGLLFGSDAATATAGITCFNNTLQLYTSSTFIAQINATEFSLPSTTYIGFSGVPSPSSTKDLFILRGAAATMQLGQNHANTPTAQCLKAHNVTTGIGAAIEIAGGTGSAGRGAVTLNGGNRAAYVAPASVPSLSGGGTVDVTTLETALSAVSSNVDSVITALIAHGIMAAS